jgi:S-adenosylmethionine:tRNA ribosyltransferase-isomerase
VRVLAGDPDAVGELPLPPYIHATLHDAERYQTVYSRRPASAAAPTAGLHLTDAVLDACAARGIALARVELVVGLDTFRPITADRVEDHPMHTEAFAVPPETIAAIESTRAAGGRVIAVGTTVVRSLESWAATGEPAGRTALFIRPGFDFQVVDRLLTNFHVPRTTLLALVAAFAGDHWRGLYDTALADERYRFLSFGDAMLLSRMP